MPASPTKLEIESDSLLGFGSTDGKRGRKGAGGPYLYSAFLCGCFFIRCDSTHARQNLKMCTISQYRKALQKFSVQKRRGNFQAGPFYISQNSLSLY